MTKYKTLVFLGLVTLRHITGAAKALYTLELAPDALFLLR